MKLSCLLDSVRSSLSCTSQHTKNMITNFERYYEELLNTHTMHTMYLKYSWKTLHRISSISSWQHFPIIKGQGFPIDQSTVTTLSASW